MKKLTKSYGDYKLETTRVLGADKKTYVNVYDGTDVVYKKTKNFTNFTYYSDRNGKSWKTRAYNQWTSLTNRCLEGGAYQKQNPKYIGCKLDEEFKDFDSFISWAEKQAGFMWVNGKGQLWQLDKDLLGDGKLYSKDTVCFLPIRLNSMLNKVKTKGVFGYSEVLSEVVDNYFSIVSEDVVDALIQKVGFNGGLNKQERLTEAENKEIQDRNEAYSVFLSKVCWIDTAMKSFDDIYKNVSFLDGVYYFKLNSVKYENFSGQSKNIKYILLKKHKSYLERLDQIMIENQDSEFWLEKCYDKKYLDLKDLIVDRIDCLEKKLIPLKQFVEIEVF